MCSVEKNDVKQFLNNRLKDAKHEKIAIVLVGGPGSGKSTGKQKTLDFLNKKQSQFVNIDPDEILTALFNNNNDCYPEVSVINNRSFDLSIKEGKNIIFDGTGKSFKFYSRKVIKRLKRAGYTVNLVIVSNNVDTVLRRIKERAKKTGRSVDESYTREVYTVLNTAIPKYLDLDCSFADAIFLFDNSTDEIKLIYSTICDKDNIKTLKCMLGVCHGRKTRKARKTRKVRKTRKSRKV